MDRYRIDVVVDVKHEGDHGAHEAHVADGVGPTCNATALHVLTFLLLFLILKFKKKCFLDDSVHFLKSDFFFGLPHLATYIFLIFSMNELELGAGIDPGMALTLTISI